MKLIPLSQGKFAMVDDSDYDAVMQFKWYASKNQAGNWYAARSIRKPDGTRTRQCLHQFLLPGVKLIDHWDGDGLNNQRHNLRPCTCSQNNANKKSKEGSTSDFLGVSWCAWGKKWEAQTSFEGKKYHLGRFASEEDAARAYDTAARKFHKEFARLNFPI